MQQKRSAMGIEIYKDYAVKIKTSIYLNEVCKRDRYDKH